MIEEIAEARTRPSSFQGGVIDGREPRTPEDFGFFS
jgi:hypothetical protein